MGFWVACDWGFLTAFGNFCLRIFTINLVDFWVSFEAVLSEFIKRKFSRHFWGKRFGFFWEVQNNLTCGPKFRRNHNQKMMKKPLSKIMFVLSRKKTHLKAQARSIIEVFENLIFMRNEMNMAWPSREPSLTKKHFVTIAPLAFS